VSPLRPDLVDCWIFRGSTREEAEILLLRRAPGRILPGLWQCVSGSVDTGERIALAALRELREETGFESDVIEAFYDLDLVNQFHEPSVDGVVLSAVFAVRVAAGLEPILSHEHTAARWLAVDEARREVVWPGYREAIDRVREHLLDPARAGWFELNPGDGSRILDAEPSAAGGVDSGHVSTRSERDRR
jgi:8-oxo-dGTP diphosphatase